MTGPTPGPWFVRRSYGKILSVGVFDKNGAVICLCKNAHDNKLANGALLAAAPDLLAALEGALPILEGANSRCTQDTVMILNVRAAIAKAKETT